MHALFGMRHGFPLHRNLRPIFVSFHCNKRDLLTPEAIDYLKRYGPVGCRDWTTVDLLLSLGVPAFFSGCLTTTIDTVFPDREPPAGATRRSPTSTSRRRRARAAPWPTATATTPSARRPFVANVDARARAARDLPARAPRRRHLAAALLPAGPLDRRRRRVPAEEPLGHPLRRADRTSTTTAFAAMRDGLLGKLEQVFGAILAGRAGGRGLRAVARAHRRRRRGGRAAPRARRAAPVPADRPRRRQVERASRRRRPSRTARGRPAERRPLRGRAARRAARRACRC